ncbi:MAG TPA: carbon storage regulator [Gemmataceae bacterium]|nr:carbon storage regulator [Gemmataceae bacterium]
MLVLSRKLGEKIYINDNICITVVDIDRGKIRLGIEAPREVPIFRQELLADGIHPKADAPVVAAKG